MASALEATAHVEHDEEEIHLPEPSIWPLIVAIGVGLLPVAGLMGAHGHALFPAVGGAGAGIALIGAFGWALSVIREKPSLDLAWGNRCLSMAWKLFLVSEGAIFGAFFGHYFYTIYHASKNVGIGNMWPPAGTPHIHLIIPAVGTGVLVLSSLTCEFAHKALLVNNRSLCKNWLVITLLLGFAFIAMQGYEWGILMAYDNFTLSSGYLGTIFYLITGFHGFHVITGLLMLLMVYVRLELGSFDRKRHFSMNAASWYWHFVDVIWLFVFFTLYVGIQH